MTRTEISRRRSEGLTLTEMLVVIGICGTMALLLVPVVFKCRSTARATVCADNLRGMGQAMTLFMTGSNGTLPDTYYSFDGHDGVYGVLLRNPQTLRPDITFQGGLTRALACPEDEKPVTVTTKSDRGDIVTIPCSYGYNVALPLMFRNVSRMGQPVNTVAFYDGDLNAAVGKTWQSSCPHWAESTVRYRHAGEACFLYVDGHVQRSAMFPEEGFEGYMQWVNSSLDTRPLVASTKVGGQKFDGRVNINPGENHEFHLKLPNGPMLSMDDLTKDLAFPGAGFATGKKLEYQGPALRVEVKPKGNANGNSIKVDDVAYSLNNGEYYTIISDYMNVHLYNDHRNNQGKAVGKWWIEIDATHATVEVD